MACAGGLTTSIVERPEGRYTVLRPPLLPRLGIAVLLASLGGLSFAAGSGQDGVPLPISGAFCGLLILVAWRQWRLGVEIGPTVRIINFYRTRVIPWNEVLEFGFASEAWVDLVNERRQRITAFSPDSRALPYVERQCREAVRQLENRRTSRLNNRRGRRRKQT